LPFLTGLFSVPAPSLTAFAVSGGVFFVLAPIGVVEDRVEVESSGKKLGLALTGIVGTNGHMSPVATGGGIIDA
jgi:hypothetical protein